MGDTRRRLPQANDNADPCELETQFGPLLQEVLAILRRRRETPLQSVAEGPSMDACCVFARRYFPAESQSQPSAVGLRSALNQLVQQLLDDGQSPASRECCWARPIPVDDGPESEEVEKTLRVWIEDLCAVLREGHPRAIEIAAWRGDGFQERDVAERLVLPLRLLRRIVSDVRAAWQRRES
ncbi:MAG: hypothetical protein HY000_28825 [Planctomycetes bacterium]|nr:hypothetical protein [Planctomycetota bacterium]